jgi:hypothetical protein
MKIILFRHGEKQRPNLSTSDDKIKIFAPTWPKAFESQILKKTLADSIENSDSLKIEKI